VTERIEFKEILVTDPVTKKQSNAVSVIRNGRQVALLLEADRLKRALSLSLQEVEYIVDNLAEITNGQTNDTSEFWKAVLDYKRSQGRV
jgi:hypothetical protein